MGSDRKSKDKTRKRSADSRSEDEGHGKRHKKSDDYDKGSKKRDKSRHSNSDRHSKRHSGKEKKSDKKHKTEGSKSSQHPISDFKEITNDDYYSKNNEFATWLKEEKWKFFSDLSSEQTRELFSEFVEVWNSKQLESKYYSGINTAPRSSHKWKIK
ncbi:DNA topoisomerase 1 [Chenopodium quinoa]|uniref:Style cell-cycle inhibitor 1-A n=1 Tax=Chenopodium quinoa TaxID=63459 RepID=A0A803MZ68_CHEQI|nr:DNA topoisomerase 1 [Chenopodium quinoa]XP_021757361.1 DNA topoisomerase 1 [Chenopodium quinoa]XP_021757362.1 DNA topoisomerase 1 [Chenopodium quinoa]